MSRHTKNRDGVSKPQITISNELLDLIRERAEEATEAWHVPVSYAAIIRHAVDEYLAQPLEGFKPEGFDRYKKA